jgi:hypothetical protein
MRTRQRGGPNWGRGPKATYDNRTVPPSKRRAAANPTAKPIAGAALPSRAKRRGAANRAAGPSRSAAHGRQPSTAAGGSDPDGRPLAPHHFGNGPRRSPKPGHQPALNPIPLPKAGCGDPERPGSETARRHGGNSELRIADTPLRPGERRPANRRQADVRLIAALVLLLPWVAYGQLLQHQRPGAPHPSGQGGAAGPPHLPRSRLQIAAPYTTIPIWTFCGPGTPGPACFENAIKYAPFHGVIVITPGTWPADTTAALPANVALRFEPFGELSVASGQTLTILGPVAPSQTTMFTGAGQVSFVGNRFVGRLNVRWWGAVGDGQTDDTAALQATMTASADAQIPVYVPPGVYMTSNISLGDPNNASQLSSSGQAPGIPGLWGAGGQAWTSVFRALPGTTGYLLTRENQAGIQLRDFTIDSANTADGCLDLSWKIVNGEAPATEDTINDLRCVNFTGNGAYGLWLDNLNDSEFNNISVVGPAGAIGVHADAEGGWIAFAQLRSYYSAVWVSAQNASFVNCLFLGGIVIGGFSADIVSIVGAQIWANQDSGVAVNSTANVGATLSCVDCWVLPESGMGLAGNFSEAGVTFLDSFLGPGTIFGPIVPVGGSSPPPVYVSGSMVASDITRGGPIRLKLQGAAPAGFVP